MAFTVTLPNGSNIEGMLKIQQSEELKKYTKILLLCAANAIANDLNSIPVTEGNRLINIVSAIIREDAERSRYADIIINAGIVRGIFPMPQNINEDYQLPNTISNILIELINELINNNSLINLI